MPYSEHSTSDWHYACLVWKRRQLPTGKKQSSPARTYQHDSTDTFHQQPSISKRPHAGPTQVPLPTALASPNPSPPAHHQPTTSAARGHRPPQMRGVTKSRGKEVATTPPSIFRHGVAGCGGLRGAARG